MAKSRIAARVQSRVLYFADISQFAGLQIIGLERRASEFAASLRSVEHKVKANRQREFEFAETVVQASFLDGSEPRWKLRVSPRVTLADWLTSRDNPYFARAIVNRFWAHFFGIGLVDPVDDLSDQNSPSHPALLDELAREFAAHNYDMKFLIRTLTATRAYQLSSLVEDANQDPRLFARMPIKALSPEQLFDSLAQATGDYQPFSSQAMFAFGNRREAFLAAFAGNHESRIERPLRALDRASAAWQALAGQRAIVVWLADQGQYGRKAGQRLLLVAWPRRFDRHGGIRRIENSNLDCNGWLLFPPLPLEADPAQERCHDQRQPKQRSGAELWAGHLYSSPKRLLRFSMIRCCSATTFLRSSCSCLIRRW